MKHTIRLALAIATCMPLCGCDLIDSLMADPKAAQREADGKAVGGACRDGARGIEDCFTLNPKASKAAMFAGWKEMDIYMRENKMETSVSKIPLDGTPTAKAQEPESSAPAPTAKVGSKKKADTTETK